MSITYYKRFRMEIDLLAGASSTTTLPAGFRWVPWEESLVDRHADVKYECFRSEIDAHVFPCLGDRQGCLRLMREIRLKAGFLPAATWLILGDGEYVGTIQGVMDKGPIGAIQNVGVVPWCRGMGLGQALVSKCLEGFLSAGLTRAYLEVTAENQGAVRLYRSLGFRKAKTLYKAVAV
ncbi:MAG: GNAT family N-acetyltransferase [Isosphaeraceae bacterium]|nr:GNAT family N-acetyltransferase [Isosphaeraceae bacterium]